MALEYLQPGSIKLVLTLNQRLGTRQQPLHSVNADLSAIREQ